MRPDQLSQASANVSNVTGVGLRLPRLPTADGPASRATSEIAGADD
jgi:hypothetical protein